MRFIDMETLHIYIDKARAKLYLGAMIAQYKHRIFAHRVC